MRCIRPTSRSIFICVFVKGHLPVKGAVFGEGSGRILLDDLMCNGSESALTDCQRRQNLQLFESNCDHGEDAGVMCQGNPYCLGFDIFK